jgi:hypothetical protein
MNQIGPADSVIYVLPNEDERRGIVSVATLRLLLKNCDQEICFDRIGTIGFEHLFGVTNLYTKGKQSLAGIGGGASRAQMMKEFIAELHWHTNIMKRNLAELACAEHSEAEFI